VLDQPRSAGGKFEWVGSMLCDFRSNSFFRRLRNPFNLDSLAVCGAPWSAISMREEIRLSPHITPHAQIDLQSTRGVQHTEIDPYPLMTTQDLRLTDRPPGPGKLPDRSVGRKPEIQASNPLSRTGMSLNAALNLLRFVYYRVVVEF
jgi:hypothetical protein